MAEGLYPLDGIYCPVIDARRAQVYTALFRREGDALIRLTEDDLIPIDTLLSMLSAYGEPVLLAGDAKEAVVRRAREAAPALIFPELPSTLTRPAGEAVARCALRAIRAGKSCSEEQLVPVYLRPTQAERERKEREEQQTK